MSVLLISCKRNGIENIKNIISPKQAAKNFITLLSGCLLLCLLGCGDNNVRQQPLSQPSVSASVVSFASEKQPDISEVLIEGIVYNQDKPLAIINGQILSVQDEIGNLRVIDISPSTIILQNVQTRERIVKEFPKTEIVSRSVDKEVQNLAEKTKTLSPFVAAKTIETSQALIYLPAKITSSQKYPLLIVLSADGNAQAVLSYLKEICEKYKWIMLVSKKFHAGIDIQPVIADIALNVKTLSVDFPIDIKRVVVTGFSSAAMGAHFFSWADPNLVSAIIVNTGIIHENFRKANRPYPNKKYAVFLASPTDFLYKQMQADRRFLEQLGWQVKWIEFKGGHTLAPQSAYEEAIQWLKMKL